ncbi:ATP-binding protein [Thermodesulfobacteriota bacterium]
MKELSLHILDVIENGISSGADLIELSIDENKEKNLLEMTITDNGNGIPEDIYHKVMDPFFTTKTTRRVGLGLSLFREASHRCEGEFNLKSQEGKGTEVFASFQLDHIDLTPMGDLAGTLITLIVGNQEVDFLYSHKVDKKELIFDTRVIKSELDGIPVSNPEVFTYLSDFLKKSLNELRE